MSEPKEVKKGGFGAFEAQYRDRWDAKHPNKAKAPDDTRPAADDVASPKVNEPTDTVKP